MNAFICIIPSGKNDGQQQEHLTYISTYKLCMYKWWIFYSYMYIYSQELAYRSVHPFDDTYKLTCPRSECMKPHSSVIQNSEDKLFRPQVCTAVPTFYKIMKYKIEGKGLEKISVDLFSYSLYKFIFIFRVILIYRY